MAKKGAPVPVYIARVGITSDIRGVRVEPGEPVPPEVIADAPWLLEQGAAYEAQEGAAPGDGIQPLAADANVAPSGSSEVAPVELEPADAVEPVELEPAAPGEAGV
jgi:hypothetical protein